MTKRRIRLGSRARGYRYLEVESLLVACLPTEERFLSSSGGYSIDCPSYLLSEMRLKLIDNSNASGLATKRGSSYLPFKARREAIFRN
jgi:hypothetical protein